MGATPEQLADGLWRWTARHPEWHPGEFGREVASYGLRAGDEAILIDPLLPSDPGPALELTDELVGDRLAVESTLPNVAS